MREDRGMAYCGLACCVCSESDCPGCYARDCEHKDMCSILACCLRRGMDGCYVCDEFPCDEDMLKRRRVHVFNQCLQKSGPAEIMRCLKRSEEAGIRCHRTGRLIGDYDPESDRDIGELLMKDGVYSRGWRNQRRHLATKPRGVSQKFTCISTGTYVRYSEALHHDSLGYSLIRNKEADIKYHYAGRED